MYMKEPQQEIRVSLSPITLFVVTVSLIATIQLGIFPDPIIALAQN